MRRPDLKLVLALLIIAFSVVAVAGLNADTTMTWVVPSAKSITVSYGGSCSTSLFYFVESDANIDSDVDGNGVKVPPNSSSSGGDATLCQAENIAGITITNAGNVTTSIDGNFTGTAFGGTDFNLVLKVWMGRGGTTANSNGACGAAGAGAWGGWQSPCAVTVATNPVTNATCRAYDYTNDANNARLVTSLPMGDSNQLCFSGDFNGTVPQGSHGHGFRVEVR